MDSLAPTTPTTQPIPPLTPMGQALTGVLLAERLLQIHAGNDAAHLPHLRPADRVRYLDAAAVALARLDEAAHLPALYTAAQSCVDLATLTPLQRRGVLEMCAGIVDRYLEALAGRHARTADDLAPLRARDLRAAAYGRY